MDKLVKYRQLIQQMLTDYAQYKPAHGEIDVETIFDTERDHYQVINVGWDRNKYVYGCAIDIDIKNGKIWLQWNSTEEEIAEYLVALLSTKRKYCYMISTSIYAKIYTILSRLININI